MTVRTVNPYSGEKLAEFEEDSPEQIRKKFDSVSEAQKDWGRDLDERINYMKKSLKPSLERNLEELAKLMSSEMGKSVTQSRAEIKKTITLAYLNASNFIIFLCHSSRGLYWRSVSQ